MKQLQAVVFILSSSWRREAGELAEKLEAEGISCFFSDGSGKEEAGRCSYSGAGADEFRSDPDHTVLITDNRDFARRMGRRTDTAVCIGCERNGVGFFEGAGMVTDSLETLDAGMLEEYLCHSRGIPLTAARTKRLILREIAPEDFTRLYQISIQPGMQFAQQDGKENIFLPELLRAYCAYTYRLYGYGLWSVWLHEDMTGENKTGDNTAGESMAGYKLIGCCGLADCDWEDGENRLELQYMLDESYRGHGYGTEMCRAAIRYAFFRTETEKLWLRIHQNNVASVGLAAKLGFVFVGKSGNDMLHFVVNVVDMYKLIVDTELDS